MLPSSIQNMRLPLILVLVGRQIMMLLKLLLNVGDYSIMKWDWRIACLHGDSNTGNSTWANLAQKLARIVFRSIEIAAASKILSMACDVEYRIYDDDSILLPPPPPVYRFCRCPVGCMKPLCFLDDDDMKHEMCWTCRVNNCICLCLGCERTSISQRRSSSSGTHSKKRRRIRCRPGNSWGHWQ